MKRSLCFSVTCGVAFLVSGANAADIYTDNGGYRGAPVYTSRGRDWTGGYIGANVGYAFQYNSDTVTLTDDLANTNRLATATPNGFLGGGQLGYNIQRDQFVFGVETDLEGSNAHDTNSGTASGNPYSIKSSLQWVGTTRGRLGVAMDRTLLYATAGLAYGGISDKLSFTDTTSGHAFYGKRETTEVGYVLGGGAEFMLNNAWSVKFEYQYIDLGSDTVPGSFNNGTSATSSSLNHDYHTVRVGFNYTFNRSYDPLK